MTNAQIICLHIFFFALKSNIYGSVLCSGQPSNAGQNIVLHILKSENDICLVNTWLFFTFFFF